VKQLTTAEALEILEAADRNHARWKRLELAHETYAWVIVLLDESTGRWDKTSPIRWTIAKSRYGWFQEPTGEGHTVLLSKSAYRDRNDLWHDRTPAVMGG
jgi:hypothetical protein